MGHFGVKKTFSFVIGKILLAKYEEGCPKILS